MTVKRTKNIDCTHTIDEYIYKFDWRIKANANSGYSAAGLINNISGKVIANYWLEAVYSEAAAEAHREGAIHIHDLDCLTPYCAGWSLRQLLDEGFNGVRGRTQSSPPNHFSVALGQMANFMGILQSEWAGAQAFSSFDTYLAPYVFKDKLSYSEIKKNIRQFVFNMNVPSRWGQSPFTNVTIDWTVPNDLKNQFPTKNNLHLYIELEDEELLKEAQKRDSNIESLDEMTFKHFQPEMDLINRAFYEVLTEGDRDGQPFTFPIPTVNITEDFDWGNPNAKYLFENTAKIGSSYFQNFIGSQYNEDKDGNKVKDPNAYGPDSVRSMCCRLRLDLRELYKRGNGLFGSGELTGSIGVVTINLARLGFLHKENKEMLLKELDYLLGMSEDTLERKRIFVKQQYDSGLYPFTKRYLKNFDHHFSTIGINGMNEMIRNFTNDTHNISDEWGIKFAIDILDYIRDKLHKFQTETGNLYNLEATPGEGTCYRFAKEDKKRHPDIIQAGFGKHIYYTNSSQLPVSLTDDPFEALKLQDPLQCRYTGGTVFHLYMREKIEDAETCKRLIKTIMTNFKMPYITITPIFSICSKHGYLSGEHEYCPECDKELLKEEYIINK